MSIAGGANSGVEQLLGILSNPEQFRSKLEELRAAAKVAEDQIALAAPASEIVQLREQLRKAKEAQDARDASASAHHAQMMSDAQEEVDALIAEAKKSAESMQREASAAFSKAQAARGEIDRQVGELETRTQALRERERSLLTTEQAHNIRQTDLEKREAAVEAERKRLAALASNLQSALG